MHCEQHDKKEKIIYITIKLFKFVLVSNFYRMLKVKSSNPGHDRLKSLNRQRYAGHKCECHGSSEVTLDLDSCFEMSLNQRVLPIFTQTLH